MKTDTTLIWKSIYDLHLRHNESSLRQAFEMGDLILAAIIHTGLCDSQVIQRIIEEAGDYAHSTFVYWRAMDLSRTLSKSQRETIIAARVPVSRVMSLCSDKFEDRRTDIISKIKRGHIKAPFEILDRPYDVKRKHKAAEIKKQVDHGYEQTDDTVVIRLRSCGEFDPDLMLDGLRSLVSQVRPFPVLVAQLNRAIELCAKSGLDVKTVEVRK